MAVDMSGIFANATEPTIIQTLGQILPKHPVDDRYKNNDPLNLYYEAQKTADMYVKMKQRRPMVFEYMKSPGKWVSITMYINPDRLTMTHQKVKGKAYTRGGIFYHHWGDDHPVMSLSGTTGLSGMKGIETLEEIYHASGTLLKYQNFGPKKIDKPDTTQTDETKYQYPTGVMMEALDMSTPEMIQDLTKKINQNNILKEKWEEYLNKLKLLDETINVDRYNGYKTENDMLRAKYFFPDGSGKDTIPLSKLPEQKEKLAKAWDDYINYKKQALEIAQKEGWNSKKLPPIQEQLKALRKQWKFEKNVEKGDGKTIEELVLLKDEWLKAFDRYILNKTARENTTRYMEENKIDLTKLQNEIKLMQSSYGFPSGRYKEVANIVLPLHDKDINDLKNISAQFLSNYQQILSNQHYYEKVQEVEDLLTKYIENSTKKSSSYELKSYAFKLYKKKIPEFDNALIAALVYQRLLYYESSMNTIYDLTSSFATEFNNYYNELGQKTGLADGSTAPHIKYRDDIVGKMIEDINDRAEALKNLLDEMAKIEQKEKEFFVQIRNNAFEDIEDEFNDEWKPRPIIIYYENRAYVGHFDRFSYSRDAANPLLIRYEMILTITKEIIGT